MSTVLVSCDGYFVHLAGSQPVLGTDDTYHIEIAYAGKMRLFAALVEPMEDNPECRLVLRPGESHWRRWMKFDANQAADASVISRLVFPCSAPSTFFQSSREPITNDTVGREMWISKYPESTETDPHRLSLVLRHHDPVRGSKGLVIRAGNTVLGFFQKDQDSSQQEQKLIIKLSFIPIPVCKQMK